MGRPLFFSLLVITVSFLPVFSLTAQEGRLFKPLAFTKTFSMFFAAMLAITLAPVLMTLLIRGKIAPEAKNPLNRFLISLYEPALNFALRFRRFVLLGALVLLLLTIFPFARLGKEFMPPLNEGDILYMPTAVPGISINEAVKILQIQDRIGQPRINHPNGSVIVDPEENTRSQKNFGSTFLGRECLACRSRPLCTTSAI